MKYIIIIKNIFILILLFCIFYLLFYNDINNLYIENLSNIKGNFSYPHIVREKGHKMFRQMLMPFEINRLSGKGCGGPHKLNEFKNKITGFGQENPTGIEHTCPNDEESQIVKDLTRVMLPTEYNGAVNI